MIKISVRHLVMLIVAIGFQCIALGAGPGRVTVSGTEFQLAGKRIYFNGANTPWNGWDDFGSVDWRNYNRSWWDAEFAKMKAKGINSTRVWISCSGDAMPLINSNGYVTGVSQQFWNDVDHYMGLASKYEIYVMPTMMSFDHTKSWNANHLRWRQMFSSQDRVKAMVDNYIVPFVLRYKNNPYFYAVDLCNEPEWINVVGDNGNLPFWQLQRYAAMSAAAIHRSGSEVLVSIGSAGIKWNSSRYDGNYWSDAALQAQYSDSEAFMDFYHIHYYKWMEPYYPLLRSPAENGIDDRPVIYGEMPGRDDSDVFPNGLTMTQAFESFLASGYDGHYPWTSNGVDSYGNLSTFGNDTLAFQQAHPALCDPLSGYLVVYNPSEATGGATPLAQAKTQNAAVTLATNSGNLVKSGLTFAGWNTAMDGSGTNYSAGATYTGNASLTLFARWTTGAPSYTVAYNANGATTGTVPASQTKTQNVNLTLASNSGNLGKNGYTFTGWNTAANGGGTSYATGATYSVNADLTLYAKWAAVPTFALTVNNGSGSGNYVQGASVSISATVPTNYRFVNWTGDTAAVADINSASTSVTMPASAVTVTANAVIDAYTVTFSEGTNGTRTGGGALVQTVDHGSAAVAPVITANAGYTFDGWDGAFDTITSDLTVTAQYSATTYTVSYNGNGNSGGTLPNDQVKTHGVDLILSSNAGNLVNDGFTFAGWNTAANGTGTDYAAGAVYSANADATLYATWSSVPVYALTVNNGTGSGSYAEGSVVAISADIAANYHFVNWTGDTAAVADVDSPLTTITMPASAVTVTANAVIDAYTVTFSEGTNGTRTGGGALVQTVDHGNAAVAPVITANAGYTFDGWDGAFDTITSDVTVTAQYTAVSYVVSLSANTTEFTESSGTAVVTATLNAIAPQNVSVELEYLGSARKVVDYTVSAEPLVIPAGQLSASSTLTAVQDKLFEGDETVVLTIASVTNAAEDGFQQVSLTITDDDNQPAITLSVDEPQIQENGGIATFTATLSDVSDQDVVVDLGFSGTALSGTDYLASDSQIYIYAGSSSGSIAVTAYDDALTESTETVVVAITAVSNAVEVNAQEKQTQIIDDDKGENLPPIANDQSLTVKWARNLAITLTGSDPEGSPLTYEIVDGPDGGILAGVPPSLNYRSKPGFKGADSFTFIVNDGTLDSAVATVSIDVTNIKPRGSKVSISTSVNAKASVVLNGTDDDGDSITFSVAAPPENGSLTGSGPELTYTPGEGYTGSDSFTYIVYDGLETSEPIAADIAVNSGNSGGGGGGGGCRLGTANEGSILSMLLLLGIVGLIRRRTVAG